MNRIISDIDSLEKDILKAKAQKQPYKDAGLYRALSLIHRVRNTNDAHKRLYKDRLEHILSLLGSLER